VGAHAQRTQTARAVEAVRGSGKPLPLRVQQEAAEQYGFGFGHVRVHDEQPAHAAAKSLHASAYTIGSDIAFAAGRYDPGSVYGRALLRHELRHVAQQHWAAASLSPQVDPSESPHERDAREPSASPAPTMSEQRIQCAPEEEQFSLGTGLVDTVGRKATSDGSWPFIKAVLEGFVGGLKSDVKAGRADAAKSHLSELMLPWNVGKFYVGYLIGLVIGLVSPITDLVKGIVGLVKLGVAGLAWLAKWSPIGVAISAERRNKIAQLNVKLNELMGELGSSLAAFASDPKGTAQKFSGFLESLMQMALSKARSIGAGGAHAIFDFLGKDFYEMGKGIGEVIGTLIAQVLLLVFSEAIGNLISKGASFVGKAAEFVAGKAVEAFTWLKGLFVEAAGLLRNAVKGALKVFEGVVNKAVEAFEALVALFSEAAAADAAGEKALAGVGKGAGGVVSTNMESRMVSGARTTPTTVAELRTPKVHPSKASAEAPGAARSSNVKGPQDTGEALDELQATRDSGYSKEAASIGSGIEAMEVEEWAAELAGKGYNTFPRNRFGEARVGGKRLSSIFTDQRARPDMIAINEAEKSIIVGDITAKPGSLAKIPGRIGQEEGLHLEKTIEYGNQLWRQLPPELGYKVFVQERYWSSGAKTKLIRIP
jgi:hypothetical protein